MSLINNAAMENKFGAWPPLLLRTITGIGFIVHGWAKVARGTAGFEKLLIQTGVPMHHLMSIIAPYTEILGGAALLTGLFTRLVALPLIVTMLTAMFTVNIHYGFSSIKTIGLTPDGPLFGPPGYEINLLYIAILLSLIITGGGKFSADHLFRLKWR